MDQHSSNEPSSLLSDLADMLNRGDNGALPAAVRVRLCWLSLMPADALRLPRAAVYRNKLCKTSRDRQLVANQVIKQLSSAVCRLACFAALKASCCHSALSERRVSLACAPKRSLLTAQALAAPQ